MRSGKWKTTKIAFLSPSGWGNLGDAAIIDSLINGVRRRVEDAEIVGFTLNPQDTMKRHGVRAYTCVSYSLPNYPASEHGIPLEGEAHSEQDDAEPQSSTTIRDLVRRLPVSGSLRTWLVAPLRLWREPAHLRRSLERLRDTSAFVVAGGGQLDGLWGGPLGHPYVLWRWARLSRAVDADYVVLSVGTGTLSRTSRFLVNRALRLARYRSYRDAGSRDLVGDARLTAKDPIVPDLAYGVPASVAAPPDRASIVVGVSPMLYRHPQHWPERSERDYEHHVHSFAALVARVLDQGYEVVVFTTDDDWKATEAMLAATGELCQEKRKRLCVRETRTVTSLFEALADVDVVVAARLHGVLLAHVAHRPVLAASHERKVRALMEDMGHGHYCIDIAEFDDELAMSRLRELIEQRQIVRGQVREYVAACRERVERQYDVVFGAPCDGLDSIGND